MENYFVVLELPEIKELKFTEGNSSHHNFWDRAANAIGKGKAKIISKRQDTGVSEEVRQHVEAMRKFSTFVLVNMPLEKGSKETTIFKKAARCIANHKCATVIDATDRFQMLSVDV